MAAVAICICSKAACEAGAVNETLLLRLAARAGLRVRRVASAPADLLINRTGCPALAFLLWRGGEDGGGAGADGTACRAARLAASFKSAYVLVPYELLGNATVLDAISSLSSEQGPCFVFMPAGAEFTERALALATALLPADGKAVAWRKQQADTAATPEAVIHTLVGLPGPSANDGDATHQANMLRMLGSLQHISQRRGDEIAANTDIDTRGAATIAAFFQRGARGPEQQCGQLLQPQMQGL